MSIILKTYCFLFKFDLNVPKCHSKTSKTSTCDTNSLITLTYKSRKGKWWIYSLCLPKLSNKHVFSRVLYCLGHKEGSWIDSFIYNFRKILCSRTSIPLAFVLFVLTHVITHKNTSCWTRHSGRWGKHFLYIPVSEGSLERTNVGN